ncbi:Uncharacterized protein PHSC3_000783 [Chlamydiales bacterium STE3]|nr:Uncharacterized protein PHSC3_000783 [Chlamydiales bacterium STE3]
MIARVFLSAIKSPPMDQAFIYLSNRLEILYEGFKKALFYRGADPFAKRLVIVPSPAMKSYLRRTMAEDPDLQITFGLEFAFLDQGLEQLKQSLSSFDKRKRLPSCIELSLNIEHEINQILKEEGHLSLWQPLIKYFKENKQKKIAVKACWLADELACLFLNYGEYGPEMLANWVSASSEDWQAELWRRMYLRKNFLPLYQALNQELTKPTHFREVHLFGLSFISDLKNAFFKKLAAVIPVYSWLLSPCQNLWSDIRSDKESNRISTFWLEKGTPLDNLESLVSLLRDRNSLLANFGRLGRHMAEMIEEHYPQHYSQYALMQGALNYSCYEERLSPETAILPSSQPLSLLEAVQADLTLLRNSEQKLHLLDEQSIQVHASSSLLREVENVYNVLLKLIAESQEPIEPHEIIVMAPEITQYAPYIDLVFGHKESLLDYQIMDLKLASKGELSQLFLQFLRLAESKWRVDDVVKLLSSPLFLKKQEMTFEEFSDLKKWLEDQQIFWGLNNAHRSGVLEKEGFKPLLEGSEKGTWQEGIDSLLMGMIYRLEEEGNLSSAFPHPKNKIDLSQADLLGKFIRFLKNMEQDLLPIANAEERTLQEWGSYFLQLLESYFSTFSYDEAVNEEIDAIIKVINRLQRSGEEIPEARFSVRTVLTRLISLFEAKEHCYREKHFQALRFSSLLPMRAVPAKVVVLMGMNEEIYPRKESKSSLNRLLKYPKKNYCPSQTDYDRYLFLEALLSARKRLLISYIAKGSSNGKKCPPSSIVNEFLDYLDAHYILNEDLPSSRIIYEHPYFSFDPRYFQRNSKFQSSSMKDFYAALAYIRQGKEPATFLRHFNAPQKSLCCQASKEHVLEIKNLQLLAKHPLRRYLNKTLGIYLNAKPQEIAELELSSLERFALKKKGLTQPIEKIFSSADKKRVWPYAPFDGLAKQKVAEDILQLEEGLERFHLKKEELFECEFSLACQKPERTSNGLLIPAPLIETQHGPVKLIGNLPTLSPKGFLFFGKKDFKNAVRHFPYWLLFSLLPEVFCEKQILFMEKQTILPPADHCEQQLRTFIEYSFMAEQTISPLMPEWIGTFLEGSPEKLQKCMEASLSDSFTGFQDPYMLWIFHEEALPDTTKMIQDWQPLAQQLFGSLQEAWGLR